MHKDLLLYSIMPLDTEHTDGICEDIREQYESGVCTCALFSMTLVPEGNPPVDKVGPLCRKYDRFRERLDAMGVPSGILVQASIGHGWVLGEMFPYQQVVQLVDGKKPNTVCPYDEGFRKYIGDALRMIASHAPAHIMIDDDLRLLFRPGGGCACPLHLSRFAELSGERLDREELLCAVRGRDARAERLSACFVETQRESLVECARVMRAAIDAVDPSIPGSFCCVGTSAEFSAEIARELAGKGNPTVVRINNAKYSSLGAKYFTESFLRCASASAKLKRDVDVILAETDTCPQNRYSTSARSLHTHFTGSILEGASGAKHWITRLASHEPESGRAYRRILGKYRGFYQTLSELVPTLAPRGFRIPVGKTAKYPLGEPWVQCPDAGDDWSRCVLERLGLPLYFSAEKGGVACLSGDSDRAFTDAEILEMLHGPIFLSSDAAQSLAERGFGKYLGVEVREWHGKTPTAESLSVNGNRCTCQMQTRELVPLSSEVREDSTVVHSLDKMHFERLFPGTTVYDNALGGKVFVFCGTPRAEHHITQAYSFLNYSRKLQLTRLLDEAGELPLWYPEDEEVYLRVADMKDGGLFCAIFNLSSDSIEDTVLACKRGVSRIERLNASGEWESVSFAPAGDGKYRLVLTVEHLLPEILRLY